MTPITWSARAHRILHAVALKPMQMSSTLMGSGRRQTLAFSVWQWLNNRALGVVNDA